jgi:hypothetical protein
MNQLSHPTTRLLLFSFIMKDIAFSTLLDPNRVDTIWIDNRDMAKMVPKEKMARPNKNGNESGRNQPGNESFMKQNQECQKA